MMRRRHEGCRSKDEPILVIITESDIDDPLRSHGAIIMEQYPSDAPEQVMKRAQMFADGGKYGRVWIGKVEALSEVSRKVKIRAGQTVRTAGPVELNRIEIVEADRPD